MLTSRGLGNSSTIASSLMPKGQYEVKLDFRDTIFHVLRDERQVPNALQDESVLDRLSQHH